MRVCEVCGCLGGCTMSLGDEVGNDVALLCPPISPLEGGVEAKAQDSLYTHGGGGAQRSTYSASQPGT